MSRWACEVIETLVRWPNSGAAKFGW